MSCLIRHLSRRSSHTSAMAVATFPQKCVFVDMYRCVHVDLTKKEASGLQFDPNTFHEQVTGKHCHVSCVTHSLLSLSPDAEKSWTEDQRIRAIWFKLPLNFSHLIPPLVTVRQIQRTKARKFTRFFFLPSKSTTTIMPSLVLCKWLSGFLPIKQTTYQVSPTQMWELEHLLLMLTTMSLSFKKDSVRQEGCGNFLADLQIKVFGFFKRKHCSN